jgi:hypothetical protein
MYYIEHLTYALPAIMYRTRKRALASHLRLLQDQVAVGKARIKMKSRKR